MVGKFCWASFLGVLLFAPIPGFGQSVKEVQSQSFDRESGSVSAATNTPDLEQVRQEIVSATNAFRREQGFRELEVNPELAKTAQQFANYMARTDKYSHTADGKEPWERTAAQGYAYCIILENIAYEYSPEGFHTTDLAHGFMDGWKKSPPHRKNLLDPDVYEIGVGVAQSSRTGRYYAVQDFGRPKSKEIVFRITNESSSPVKYTIEGKDYAIDPRYTITHEQCRPPELRFALPTQSHTFHPRNGGRYVIRKDDSGNFRVEQG
ncbi:MAG TPA: CAP domain-containing protein [Gemmataceae bacterium]|nr:CAP domain-containing protein [Gemmataceae bacterium]